MRVFDCSTRINFASTATKRKNAWERGMQKLVYALAFMLISMAAQAQGRFITLASTTSTEQSGLFNHILPIFLKTSGIEVRVVALGTGQALALAARADADVLLVHDRNAEEQFIAQGHGLDRRDVMYNDFVLVGPRSDPAKVMGLKSAREAFARIAEARALFASRGDKSGTHAKELRLWSEAGISAYVGQEWYRELGSGMGPTLNSAAAMSAYTLADRGSWLAFKNAAALQIVLEGDPGLFNPYSSILVNPAKGSHIKAADARIWHDWVSSEMGQAAIASYKINGMTLFFPLKNSPRS